MGQSHTDRECGYTFHSGPSRYRYGTGVAGNTHTDFWTAMDWLHKFRIVSIPDVSVPVGVVDVELARCKRVSRLGLQLGNRYQQLWGYVQNHVRVSRGTRPDCDYRITDGPDARSNPVTNHETDGISHASADVTDPFA